jgi:hypothetical protein
LTVTKYPHIKWQWIFSFLRKCGLSSITDKPFTGLEYMSNTVGVSSEAEPTSPSPAYDFYESVQNIRPFSHCHHFNNKIPALVFLYLLA